VKSRLQKMGVTVGIPFAVVFVFSMVAGSFPYWGWHLLHGFHTEVNGVRIGVPYFYRADTFDGRVVALSAWRPTFVTHRGDVNAGYMLIGFIGPNHEEVPFIIGPRPGPIEFVLSGPYQESGERKLTMAGRAGECKEYAFDLASSRNSLADKDTRTVYCWFGTDLRASFLGGASAQRKFYELIQSAELVGGRR
jgi:hypothetical protein